MNIDTLWEGMLHYIKDEINPNAFNTWFKNTSLKINGDGEITVFAGNDFAADWISKNYNSIIQSAADKAFAKKMQVSIRSVIASERELHW